MAKDDFTPTQQDRALWDREAEGFDDAVDHGLRDPRARTAWSELLLPLLGHPARRIADLGCGTGSLSLLLAEAGHTVTGVDLSPAMIDRARQKTAGLDRQPVFLVADASDPPLPAGEFDVVLSRHVLWAMPDPAAALARWARLLAADGQLILVEGKWSTGAGLSPAECTRLVEQTRGPCAAPRLLTDPDLWGGPITDERYLIVSAPVQ